MTPEEEPELLTAGDSPSTVSVLSDADSGLGTEMLSAALFVFGGDSSVLAEESSVVVPACAEDSSSVSGSTSSALLSVTGAVETDSSPFTSSSCKTFLSDWVEAAKMSSVSAFCANPTVTLDTTTKNTVRIAK